MPELRFNVMSDEWVIVSPESSKRPLQFASSVFPGVRKKHDPMCPFCPGNESATTEETYRRYSFEDNTWLTRVVLNKYPALNHQLFPKASGDFLHPTVEGFGIHEVIIDTPRHDWTLTSMPKERAIDLFATYCYRYRACERDPRVQHIILFKNHGESAGSSILHAHSQLIAVPIVSNQIDARLRITGEYLDQHGRCLTCTLLDSELKDGVRIIEESEHFVALIPYAAVSSYHTWIIPRRHNAQFSSISDEELEDLAILTQHVVKALEIHLNNPDYNMLIRSAPVHCANERYHWYLSIIPRLSKTAGFEMGCGIYINGTLPEDNARYLREVIGDLSASA